MAPKFDRMLRIVKRFFCILLRQFDTKIESELEKTCLRQEYAPHTLQSFFGTSGPRGANIESHMGIESHKPGLKSHEMFQAKARVTIKKGSSQ